jgi:hypothetical protein
VTVESYAVVETSGTPIKGRDNRIRRAEEMAAAQDFDHWLDEKESYVVPKNVPSSQGRETYVHSNIRQYINEILIKEDQERQELATVRAMLDCLFGKLGYVPYYMRKPKDLSVEGIKRR